MVVGHHLLLRGVWPYVIIFTIVCVVISFAMTWLSFTVQRLLGVWDSIITAAMVMLKGGPLYTAIVTSM
jgi:hypothetical protein